MTNTQYNGWTNYETWNANLWIDEDQLLSENIALITADLSGSYEEVEELTAKVSDYIKEAFIDNEPELVASFYADMISASLREVNFYEIAGHFVGNELQAQAIDATA